MATPRVGLIKRDAKDWYQQTADECAYRLTDLNGEGIINFCPEMFHRYTTLRLRPGQGPVKVRINIEVVE